MQAASESECNTVLTAETLAAIKAALAVYFRVSLPVSGE
jgi:hypothetical protein